MFTVPTVLITPLVGAVTFEITVFSILTTAIALDT